jgi:hypothetical protein
VIIADGEAVSVPEPLVPFGEVVGGLAEHEDALLWSELSEGALHLLGDLDVDDVGGRSEASVHWEMMGGAEAPPPLC